MTTPYKVGTTVEWNWGEGTATGDIQDSFAETVTRTFKGTEVKRNASSENPAYLIAQTDGDEVLKSHSEIYKA